MEKAKQTKGATAQADQGAKGGEQIPKKWKYILYAEKGKEKKRVPIIRANGLGELVRALYMGLHRQQTTGKRMFTLSGSNALYIEFMDDTPFAAFRKLVPNSFSPLALYDTFLDLEKIAGGALTDFPELEAQFRTLREEKERYIASAHHKALKPQAENVEA